MSDNATGTDASTEGSEAESSTSSTSSESSTTTDNPSGTGTPESSTSPADTPDSTDDSDDGSEGNASDTFPRSYVEKLRRESAGYREQANKAGQLAQRLHTELVRATGKLADPTDLPFDAEHLESTEALTGAIDGLLQRKPHLASRRPSGDIGQGATGNGSPVDLAGMLRARA